MHLLERRHRAGRPRATRSKRSGDGVTRRLEQLLGRRPGGRRLESSSRERIALANDSRKVRPIAIASPTDFMWVVRLPSAPGNFSKAKRGIFVTT